MSGIAQLLLACGYQVSGSDLRENRITLELKKEVRASLPDMLPGMFPERIR